METTKTQSPPTFCATAGDLKAFVAELQGVVNLKSYAPCLQNIALRLEGGELIGRAFDQTHNKTLILEPDAEAEDTFGVQAQPANAAALVSGEQLLKLLRQCAPDLFVSLCFFKAKLVINFEGAKYELPTYDYADFPPPPDLDEAICRIKLPAELLREAVSVSAPFCSTDNLHDAKETILFEFDFSKQTLNVVATNYHILSRMAIPLEESPELDVELNITLYRTIEKILLTFLARRPGEVEVIANERNIVFKHGPDELSVQQMQLQFPDWRRVFKSSLPNRALFGTSGLLKSISRLRVAANNVSNLGVIGFKEQDNNVRIITDDPDMNRVGEELAPVIYHGEEILYGLNLEYLETALKTIDAPEIYFDLDIPSIVALITPHHGDIDKRPVYDREILIMPVDLMKQKERYEKHFGMKEVVEK